MMAMHPSSMAFFLLFPLIVEGASDPDAFYHEKERGWFWKEQPPLPSEPPPPSPKTQAGPEGTPSPNTSNERPLTSAWFRQNLGRIRDDALDDPSPEKVRRYFILQRALLDKAEQFSKMAQTVVMEDPLLDERGRHPSNPSAQRELSKTREAARHEALTRIGQKGGLLFIFRSDCRFCHWMAPLVNGLCDQRAIKLMAVSLDGGALPGIPAHRLHVDPDLGQRLGVTATPALYLMIPPHGIHRVLEGSVTTVEIEDRLIAAAHVKGLIDEDLYLRVLGQQPMMREAEAKEHATPVHQWTAP